MFNRLQRGLAVAALAVAIAGCTSVSEPSTAPSASPLPSLPTESAAVTPSVLPTITPSVEPSEPPASLAPTKTPKPPKTAPPSTGPSLPNLVVTKFVATTDPIVAGADAEGRVTIKNVGTADAGPFALGWGFSADEGGGGGGNVPQPVDGLAAGDSVQLTVDLSLDFGGGYTFTATADSGNAITESNEDDNDATLHVTAISQANLVWPDGEFSVQPNPDGGYVLFYQVHNSGTADVTTSFKISFEWSSDDATGEFPAVDCCSGGPGTPVGIAAGDTSAEHSVSGLEFPASGTYTVVATLDSTDLIPESNEDDNTSTVQVTVEN